MNVLVLAFPVGFHGADPGMPSVPEWPPHPDRVFQALVATAYESGLMPALRPALEELEAKPPRVVWSSASGAEAPKVFVPTNFDGAHVGSERRFPSASGAEQRAAYVWHALAPDTQAALARLAGLLTHVGRAKSLVLGQCVDAVPALPSELVPDPDGEVLLRTAHAGRLQELDDAFARGGRSPPARYARYRDSTEAVGAAPWRLPVVLRLERPIDARNLVGVTAALRAAVMSLLGDQAPASVHGHGEHAHVAWLALPDVGHSFARGEVRGLSLALPADLPAAERLALLQALQSLAHIQVDGQRIGVGIDDGAAKARQPATWVGPARRWATVTPVVADRLPKRCQTLEHCIARSVEWAGYPAPSAVALGDYSAWQGAPRAGEFRTRLPKRLRKHVVVEFAAPQRGPLLVGAERYFGLGLFRPLP